MKTKTRISKQTKRKTNSDLIETINSAKKNEKWMEVASLLSTPRRKRINLNLGKIDESVKEGDIIVIPGKVLSEGEITKKIKLIALGFSEMAKEKLLNAKCEVGLLLNEIKKNPDAKGIKILR